MRTGPSAVEKKEEAFPVFRFALLFAVALFADVVSAMLSSSLSLYVARLGGAATTSGAIFSLYYIVSMAMRPVSGILSDRFGYTRAMLVGTALCVVSAAMMAGVPAVGILFAAMFVRGIGLSCVTTSSSAKLSRVVPARHFDYALGIFALNLSIANAAGPGIATSLALQQRFPALFVLCTVLSAASFAAVLYFAFEERGMAMEPVRKRETNADAGGKGIWRVLEKQAARTGVLQILSQLALSSVTVFLALYMSGKGVGNAGIFFTAAACAGAGARFSAGFLSKHFPIRRILTVSMVCMIAILASLVSVRTRGAMIATGVAYGFSQGTIFPILMIHSIKSAPTYRKGRASATYYLCNDVGSSIGSLVWGYVVDATGYTILYYLAACVIAAAIFLIPWAFRKID